MSNVHGIKWKLFPSDAVWEEKILIHFFAIRFSTSVTSVCQDMMADSDNNSNDNDNNNVCHEKTERGCEATRLRGQLTIIERTY